MAVLLLMLLKFFATFFSFMFQNLAAISTVTPLMLYAWGWSENAFVSTASNCLLLAYPIVFFLPPLLACFKKNRTAIVGLAFVIALNLCDIVTVLLTAASVTLKIVNVLFSALIIGVSIWKIRDNI